MMGTEVVPETSVLMMGTEVVPETSVLMMGTEMVPETSVSSYNQLSRLIAREEFIAFSRHENLKSFILLLVPKILLFYIML
jgi:hypothetical protein